MAAQVSIIMSAKARPISKQFRLVAKHNKKESENSYTTMWGVMTLGFWFL